MDGDRKEDVWRRWINGRAGEGEETTPLIRRRMYTRYVVDNARGLGGPWMRLYAYTTEATQRNWQRERESVDARESKGDRWAGKRVGSSSSASVTAGSGKSAADRIKLSATGPRRGRRGGGGEEGVRCPNRLVNLSEVPKGERGVFLGRILLSATSRNREITRAAACGVFSGGCTGRATHDSDCEGIPDECSVLAE